VDPAQPLVPAAVVVAGMGAGLALATWALRPTVRHGGPARAALLVGWTWLWAEVLAGIMLPGPGPVSDRWLDERSPGDLGVSLPGDVGRPPDDDPRPLVLAIGDSFTQGQGAPPAWSVPSRLARALAEDGVRVRNHGVRGSQFVDQLTRYALLDRETTPDVLLWMITLNDLEPQVDGLDAITQLGGGAVAGPTPLTGALRRAWAAQGATAAMEAAYLASFAPDGARMARLRDGLARLGEATQARGARLVVAVWPLLHRLDDYPFTAVHERLVEAAEAAGAEAVDLLPAFEGRDEEALWFHPLDHHPNSEGYRLATAPLLEALRSRPIGGSKPWRPDDPVLLTGDARQALERRWAADRSADTLHDGAVALRAIHRAWLEGAGPEPGSMVGRVPRYLMASAWLRRGPDDEPGRARDRAALDRWASEAPR